MTLTTEQRQALLPWCPPSARPAGGGGGIPGNAVVLAVLVALSFAVARFERGSRRVGATPSPPVLVGRGAVARGRNGAADPLHGVPTASRGRARAESGR